jgi:hypothetical protein
MFDNNKRFQVIHKESSLGEGCKIFVDKETGVNYLFTWAGYGGGLTVLVDSDGKPIVSAVER